MPDNALARHRALMDASRPYCDPEFLAWLDTQDWYDPDWIPTSDA